MSLRLTRSLLATFAVLATAPAMAQQSPWPAPIAPAAPVAPVAPAAPVVVFDGSWGTVASLSGQWGDGLSVTSLSEERLFGPPMQRYPQDPADSLYREARTLLNRGEWRRAATLFARVADHKPASRYAADALHWQAFALYRIGGTNELRQGLAALEARTSRFPEAGSESEATTLATRIRGALAARGDRTAEAALMRQAQAGTETCDSEDLSVRASALSAIMRSDPEAGQQLLSRVLDRRDECSVSLRKSAVMMLGNKGDDAAKAKLAAVVRTDPDDGVRGEAISYLARTSGDEVVPTLEQVIRSDSSDRLRRTAVRALGAHESPRARAAIRALVENSAAPENLRLEALSTFDRGSGYSFVPIPLAPTAPRPAVAPRPAQGGGTEARAAAAAQREVERERRELERELERAARENARVISTSQSGGVSVITLDGQQWQPSSSRRISPDDAAWLRGLYPRLETNRLKSRAVAVLARSGDDATLDWLMNLVQREEEPADIRATVLSRLGRDLPITSLIRLFDGAANRTVRQQIVSTLGARKEPEATDKLFEIVRSGTDPQLRRSAIGALTRKNDPRTTQLLLELIDK